MTLCTPTDTHKKSLTKTLRKLKLKINENKKQIKQITKTKRKKSKTQNSKEAIPISLRERVLRPSLPSAAVTAVLRVFFDPVQIITHPRVHSGITSARASLAPGDDRCGKRERKKIIIIFLCGGVVENKINSNVLNNE